ncbi:lipid-A-disaccharide synthase [Cognatishimia sp. MH4019]|uniref:lipid-A-disaccharide synthase n=1 Tax=Cognatishimia sp. MH4019 TaxID=2854030 RepID=UPI001CD43721|nr:lipid-A-disaccharide synthase [Cognatishimia sp. MH4019]
MKIFVIAGEASGDKLGGAALAGLRSLVPDLEIHGVGGPLMQAQGLESLFPMDELSVMGIAEVLPKYRHLKRRIAQTAEAVLALKPDVLLTIDSPDFSLRVARRVKAASAIRTVHYVAPTVWAWRRGRAKKMVGVVDQVLALFPFEPPYMEAVGIRCDFVGHPVVAEAVASEEEARDFRVQHGLGDAPVLLALPGSRRGEINRLAGTFGAALAPVLAAHPEMRVVVPAAPGVIGLVRETVRAWPGSPLVIDNEMDKRAAFKAATVALAASGTVSLELAASGTPMVIAYDMNWLSRQIIARMLKVDTVTLVNLVSDTRVVPEFLGIECEPKAIAQGLSDAIANPNAQLEAMSLTMQRLGQGDEDPGLRAARAILDGVKLF